MLRIIVLHNIYNSHHTHPNTFIFQYCFMSSLSFGFLVPLLVMLFIFEVQWNKKNVCVAYEDVNTFALYQPNALPADNNIVQVRPIDTSLLSFPSSNHTDMLNQLVFCECSVLISRRHYSQTLI